MCLPKVQVDRFYEIWRPLLNFANEVLKVVPNLSGEGPKDSIDVNLAVKVRNALWENETVLNQFIEMNPAGLSPEDLDIVASWKYHRQGRFFVFKVLKKHAIFISEEKRTDIFAVKGLYSPFDAMLGPYLPRLVETVLLPFGEDIIVDGLLQSYNLTFGPGIRGNLKEVYDDAKERGAIITTLLPGHSHTTRESLVGEAETTNSKVLEAFSKHQYKSGRSPKTAERDITMVEQFSRALLVQEPEPVSLRNFGIEALNKFLEQLPEAERKTASLSVKRFISFERDTSRLDWDEAENMLDLLKRPA